MSATVRRLVCDVPLRWLLIIALQATAILCVDVDGLLGPMPRVAPVTSATLPSSPRSMIGVSQPT